MVTQPLERVGASYSDALADLDLLTLGVGAALTVGGFLVAQELTDVVLPMIDFPLEPQEPSELAVSAGVKVAGAFALAWLAARSGDMAMAILGGLTVGMLGSAGLDVWDIAQRAGIPGNSPSAPAPAINQTPTPTPTPQPTASGGTRPVAAGGRGTGSGYRGT